MAGDRKRAIVAAKAVISGQIWQSKSVKSRGNAIGDQKSCSGQCISYSDDYSIGWALQCMIAKREVETLTTKVENTKSSSYKPQYGRDDMSPTTAAPTPMICTVIELSEYPVHIYRIFLHTLFTV